MEILRNAKIVIPMSDGKKHDYVAASKIAIPVNKENVRKYGIVAERDMDKVLDTLVLNIPSGSYISKTDLMVLDMLCNYDWERPIYFLQQGGEISIGIKDYMQYDGFAYKFVPIKSRTGHGEITQVDERLYDRIMNVYKWDNLSDSTINVDYQNLLTFNNLCSPRDIIVNCEKWLHANGENGKAVELLDKMPQIMPSSMWPLNNSVISSLTERAIMDAVAVYVAAGEVEKAEKLADELLAETEMSIALFSTEYKGNFLSTEDLQRNLYYIYMISEVFTKNNQPELAKKYSDVINQYLE